MEDWERAVLQEVQEDLDREAGKWPPLEVVRFVSRTYSRSAKRAKSPREVILVRVAGFSLRWKSYNEDARGGLDELAQEAYPGEADAWRRFVGEVERRFSTKV